MATCSGVDAHANHAGYRDVSSRGQRCGRLAAPIGGRPFRTRPPARRREAALPDGRRRERTAPGLGGMAGGERAPTGLLRVADGASGGPEARPPVAGRPPGRGARRHRGSARLVGGHHRPPARHTGQLQLPHELPLLRGALPRRSLEARRPLLSADSPQPDPTDPRSLGDGAGRARPRRVPEPGDSRPRGGHRPVRPGPPRFALAKGLGRRSGDARGDSRGAPRLREEPGAAGRQLRGDAPAASARAPARAGG